MSFYFLSTEWMGRYKVRVSLLQTPFASGIQSENLFLRALLPSLPFPHPSLTPCLDYTIRVRFRSLVGIKCALKTVSETA